MILQNFKYGKLTKLDYRSMRNWENISVKIMHCRYSMSKVGTVSTSLSQYTFLVPWKSMIAPLVFFNHESISLLPECDKDIIRLCYMILCQLFTKNIIIQSNLCCCINQYFYYFYCLNEYKSVYFHTKRYPTAFSLKQLQINQL